MNKRTVPVRSTRATIADESTRLRTNQPKGEVRLDPPHRSEPGTFLEAVGIYKTYRKGKHEVPVLNGVDLAIKQGEFVSIVGQSGSGKSTLLHLLGTLDAPDEGEIHFDGERVDNLRPKLRDALRNRELGMIFQFYHLLPELSALENVLMPGMIGHSIWSYWSKRRELAQRAEALLERVGMSHRLRHTPRELSGGEMQRTAIARALISSPRLLLADEPTGNLDRETGRGVMDLLLRLHKEEGLTIVMVTHDESLAKETDRTVRLVAGKVA
jgi:lipoprotein-releasing system ATP-binding protein